MVNESEVFRWFDIFKGGNQLVEIRLISNDGKTASGYFTDARTMIDAIRPYEENYSVYFTINSVNPECYGRPQRNKIIMKPKNTTTDAEIIGRDFVLLDLDSKRATGVSATDEQLNMAKQKANEVYKFLLDNGFYAPIVVCSGSGVHLYLRCALKATDENNKLINRFTDAMAMLFSDENVDIDRKVFNLGRISRVVGYYNRKGSKDDPLRPQRLCQFVKIPREVKINEKEYFEKIAKLYPEDEKPNRENNYRVERFNLDDFIQKYNIPVTKIEKVDGGRKFVLDHCPFNENHRGKDAVLFQRDSGEIAFHCFHNSCSDKGWREFRLLYEPNAYERTYKDRYIRREDRYKKVFEPIVETEDKGDVWLQMGQIKKPQFDISDYIPSGVKQIDDLIIGFKRKHVSVLSGKRGCVDCDTEFFNGYEWKKISEYEQGDKVLQYNLDGTAELVYPQRYIKLPCETLHLMKTKYGVNQCVCDEHKIVYKTSKGNLAYKKMSDLIEMHNKSVNGFMGRFYTTFKYSGVGIDLSDDDIRLMCAIICDGNFPNIYKDKSIVRMNLKKQSKKDRLEMLLKKLNIEYRKEQYNPKDLNYNTYLFKSKRIEKEFSEYWYNCNNHQLSVIIDEVMYWDGCIKDKTFSTVNKKTADFIQFAFSACGIRSTINIDDRIGKNHSNGIYKYKSICYRVIVCGNDTVSIQNSDKKLEIKDYKTKDGYKYCFTVNSGMLVLRRENRINITGNCGKSSLLNMIILNAANMGYKSALWTGELDCDEEKQWLYLQASGKSYNKEAQNGFYYTPNNVCEKIDKWIDKYFWIFNNEYKNNFNQIVDKVRELKAKEDIDIVIFDNLMTLDIDDLDGDKNDRQKGLMYTLTCLAKELNIHIFIVAHPNKNMNFLRPDNISGSGHISDLAQNVFILHRINRDFENSAKDFLTKDKIQEIVFSECTNCIEICKCRDKGSAVDNFVQLYFEKESNRLKNSKAEHIIYGWQDGEEGLNSQQMPQSTQFESTQDGTDIDTNNFFDDNACDCPF